MQADLFAPDLPDGVTTRGDLISTDEERALIAAIDRAPLEPFRFQGWVGKRLTASFGWRYDFDTADFAEAPPLPDWLLPFRDRVAAFAELMPEDLPHALLTRYDPGAGIGWHRDRSVFDQVIGLSLGAPAVLRLRRRDASGFERRHLPLPPRAAYRLIGPARWDWEHSIASMDAPRWSITFRSLRR